MPDLSGIVTMKHWALVMQGQWAWCSRNDCCHSRTCREEWEGHHLWICKACLSPFCSCLRTTKACSCCRFFLLGHLSLHGAGDARVAQREARQAIFRLAMLFPLMDALPTATWYAAIWKASFCCAGVWSFFTEEKKVACWTFLDKLWQAGVSGIVTKFSFERVEHLLRFVLDQLLNRMFRHVVSPVYIGLPVWLRLDTVLARKKRAHLQRLLNILLLWPNWSNHGRQMSSHPSTSRLLKGRSDIKSGTR